MDLSRQGKSLVLVSILCLMATAFAEDEQGIRNAALEEALEKLRVSMESAAPLDETTLPEDTTPRFSVKELQISGNRLISTAELVEKLPVVYTISVDKDDMQVKEICDFRVLCEIIVDPGKEREVSLRVVQGFTKYVLSVYQDKGYRGIYVYVPAEAVDEEASKLVDQVLPIQVLEGKVAELTIDRYDFDRQKKEKGHLKDSAIRSWSPVKPGDVIQQSKVDDFTRLLSLNPDRAVYPVISRSADPNALKLGYDVYEVDPWHWFLQVDNAGTEERQWSPRIGTINTNLTGRDDRFSVMYQAPWDSSIDENYALFGSYDFPVLTPRLRLNLYGGYSQFDITPKGGPFNFLGRGSFYGSVLNYNVFQVNNWFIDFAGYLSRENSKVTPSIGLQSNVDVDLWGVGLNIHRSSEKSNTSFSLNRARSMGGSGRIAFESARVGADPHFTIYNFAASHNQFLDVNDIHRLSCSFRAITSNERLVPAKMTTFGGLYSVRGYEEDEIVADGGILASAQYEYDLVKRGKVNAEQQDSAEKQEAKEPLLRKLAPLVFVDYGRAKTKSPVAGEQGARELCSAGTGVIIEVGNDFSAGIYYGWALRGTDQTKSGEGRLNVSLTKRF